MPFSAAIMWPLPARILLAVLGGYAVTGLCAAGTFPLGAEFHPDS